MTEIYLLLLGDILNDAFATFDGALLGKLGEMLHIESFVDSAVSEIITPGIVSDLYTFIYSFACGLVILKFLFKGFEIYILWRDGDADSSLQDMLIGAVQSVVVMIAFPFLYETMANVTTWFAEGIMTRFGLAMSVGTLPTAPLDPIALGFAMVVLFLIYFIMTLVLFVKLIQRGFELLVLRLGVPVACLGLLDSDYGLFKSYMQLFYKTMFTSVIQIVLMSLSLRVISGISLANIICGIALIMTAFGTPQLMAQMLIAPGRGGGITQKIYSAGMAARSVKGLFGK